MNQYPLNPVDFYEDFLSFLRGIETVSYTHLDVYKRKYATSLYYRDSMELLSRCFCAVVEELIKGQEKTLYELPAVSFRDRLELLERPNRCLLYTSHRQKDS